MYVGLLFHEFRSVHCIVLFYLYCGIFSLICLYYIVRNRKLQYLVKFYGPLKHSQIEFGYRALFFSGGTLLWIQDYSQWLIIVI